MLIDQAFIRQHFDTRISLTDLAKYNTFYLIVRIYHFISPVFTLLPICKLVSPDNAG